MWSLKIYVWESVARKSAWRRRFDNNLCFFWNWKIFDFFVLLWSTATLLIFSGMSPPPPPKKKSLFHAEKKILLSPRPKENRMLISIIEIAVLTFFAVRGIIMIAYVPPIRMSTNPVLTKVQNGFCKWENICESLLTYTKKTHRCTKQILPTRFEWLEEK